MRKIQLICAICAALSGFMLGMISLHQAIVRHDAFLFVFAVIGFLGAAVMYVNRR